MLGVGSGLVLARVAVSGCGCSCRARVSSDRLHQEHHPGFLRFLAVGRLRLRLRLGLRQQGKGNRVREGGRLGRGGWRESWRSSFTLATLTIVAVLRMNILTLDILSMAGGPGGVITRRVRVARRAGVRGHDPGQR